MKNLPLLFLLCFLACKTETPQNTTINKPTVYILSNYFLLRYIGQLENEYIVLHIANWTDGICSGNWYNPFLKKEVTLQGEINLVEQLELKDLTGNMFVFDFSTPEKITGYFKKAGSTKNISVTFMAQPDCYNSLFPNHFFTEGNTSMWLLTCIEKLRYAVAVKHVSSKKNSYSFRYAELKNKKLVFETKGDSCDFIYKDKEGIVKLKKGKDCATLDEFVSF